MGHQRVEKVGERRKEKIWHEEEEELTGERDSVGGGGFSGD